MLCDAFFDPASRIDQIRKMVGNNPTLAQKVIAWFNRLKELFFEVCGNVKAAIAGVDNSKGMLTRSQMNNMTRVIENYAKLKTKQGKTLFTPGGLRSMTNTLQIAPRSEDYGMAASFAGEKSKTANHATLAQAKDMESRGRSRDEIYQQTGWVKGKDIVNAVIKST